MQTVQTCDAWTRFLRGIQSAATVPVYTNSLHYFMRHLKFYEMDGQTYRYSPERLLEGTDALIEDQIKGFVESLKIQGRSRGLIRTRIAAIKLFYEKNKRRSIDWDDIISEIPKTKKHKDRAYTTQEIKTAVDAAEPREKAAILLLASSGMRVGALPELTVGSLHPVDKYGIYKVIAYEGYDEEYFSFTTPEAKQAIDSYLDFRRRSGEKITPKSPLFRRDFDPNNIEAVKPATNFGLRLAIAKTMQAAGIRPKITLTEGQPSSTIRHEIKGVHGLRKFFDTQTTLAGVNPLWVEILEGHDIKLKESYFRPSENDLLEGNDRMKGYVDAIDYLTVNEENRLKLKNEKLEAEYAQLQQETADMLKWYAENVKGKQG